MSATFFALAAACVIDTNKPEKTPPIVDQDATTGLLTLDWSIEGIDDPAQCEKIGAGAIRIAITTSAEVDAGTFQDACTARRTGITLEVNHYSATAVLIDAAGLPCSNLVTLEDFAILGNDEVKTHVDFVSTPVQ